MEWNTNPIQVGDAVYITRTRKSGRKKIKIPFGVLIEVQLQFKLLRPIRIKVNT